MSKTTLFLIIVVIALLIGGGAYVYVSQNNQLAEEEPVGCAQEGETTQGTDSLLPCCAGLTKIYDEYAYKYPHYSDIDDCSLMPTPRNLICTACGNGECGLGENQCNCPEDCKSPGESQCIKEGERGSFGCGSPECEQHCCPGLTQITTAKFNPVAGGSGCEAGAGELTSNFICAYCGNGVCGLGENVCNCPSDCQQ